MNYDGVYAQANNPFSGDFYRFGRGIAYGRSAQPQPIMATPLPAAQQPQQQQTQNYAEGGMARNGTSDDVPANLSVGEYVIPADVVSALGNGSTEAGARVLDNACRTIRQQRTGTPAQPQDINPAGLQALMMGGR